MKELTQKCVVHVEGAGHWVAGGRAMKLHRARSPFPTELIVEETEVSKLRVHIDVE